MNDFDDKFEWLKDLAENQRIDMSLITEDAWKVFIAMIEVKLYALLNTASLISQQNGRKSLMLSLNDIVLSNNILGCKPQIDKFDFLTSSSVNSIENEDYNEDQTINLNHLINEKINLPAVPKIKISWLAFKGQLLLNASAKRAEPQKIKNPWRFEPSNKFFNRICNNSKDSDNKFVLNFMIDEIKYSEEDLGGLNIILEPPPIYDTYLKKEQKLYISRIIGCILNAIEIEKNSEKYDKSQKFQNRMALSKIGQSLKKGKMSELLIPLIIGILCNAINQIIIKGPSTAIPIVLPLIMAFIQNPNVDLFSYLHQVIQCLLLLILSPTIGEPNYENIKTCINIKSLAADALEVLINIVGKPKLYQTICWLLTEILKYREVAVTTIIGILMLVRVIGRTCVEEIIKPYAKNLIEMVLNDKSCDIQNFDQASKEELNIFLLELLLSTFNGMIEFEQTG